MQRKFQRENAWKMQVSFLFFLSANFASWR